MMALPRGKAMVSELAVQLGDLLAGWLAETMVEKMVAAMVA